MSNRGIKNIIKDIAEDIDVEGLSHQGNWGIKFAINGRLKYIEL